MPGPHIEAGHLRHFDIHLLNPTTVIHFAALVLGSRASDAVSPWEQGVFVLAAFLASAGRY